MIEGIELNIYMNNGKNITFDLTPTQTETLFKALGLQVDTETEQIAAFSDNSLKETILPRINFKEV